MSNRSGSGSGSGSGSRGIERYRSMKIGWPTNVRHLAHVTFDRYNGFMGLPVEFEPDIPNTPPSASATVFGVSTESMQLSFDTRGNSVPKILLLLQKRLYAQGGLEAEGIFRINAENGQEEHVRDQLNKGLLSNGIDVHCLAGLIKAWFRELPKGVLDSLTPDQVIQCQSEEDFSSLVGLLPPADAALLNWATNLMADVVQQEHLNKMNAHNIAMVFAPNMTQMADPLTALMYAVHVMNFLKALVEKELRERKNYVVKPGRLSDLDHLIEDSIKHSSRKNHKSENSFGSKVPIFESTSHSNEVVTLTEGDAQRDSTSMEGEHCKTQGKEVIDIRSNDSCLKELIDQKNGLPLRKDPSCIGVEFRRL